MDEFEKVFQTASARLHGAYSRAFFSHSDVCFAKRWVRGPLDAASVRAAAGRLNNARFGAPSPLRRRKLEAARRLHDAAVQFDRWGLPAAGAWDDPSLPATSRVAFNCGQRPYGGARA